MAAEVVIHAREDRDDEEQHADSHADGEDGNQHRIGHGRLDGAAQGVVFLKLSGKPVERLVESTARFAGLDHGDVQPVEGDGIAGHGVGQRHTGLDVFPDRRNDLLEAGVLGLLLEHVQRP